MKQNILSISHSRPTPDKLSAVPMHAPTFAHDTLYTYSSYEDTLPHWLKISIRRPTSLRSVNLHIHAFNLNASLPTLQLANGPSRMQLWINCVTDISYIFSMDVSSKYMHCSPPDIVLASSFDQYEKEKNDISVVGSLKHHSDFWDHLPASNYIKKIVAHKYTIPLKWLPKPIVLPNNASSRNECTFVRQAIDELILKKAVLEVQTPPRVVNPLNVAIKDGKKRLDSIKLSSSKNAK